MKKEELLALWNGKEWDNNIAGIYFISQHFKPELHLNFTGYLESDVFSISDDFMKRLFRELEQLDEEVHKVIQNEYPNEDVSELELIDIIFDKSGCYGAFALGYDAGESPAGQLYLLVKFDEQFQADTEFVYETY